MPRRTHLARRLAVGSALSALAAGGLAGQASAVVTTPLDSRVTVAGAGAYLQDVDLTTNITHRFSDELSFYLTSPAGTRVPISTRNPVRNAVNGRSNVFAGTVWDDSAGAPVTDATFVSDVPATTLTPEAALGAFVGENPNGTWTLSVVDEDVGDAGALNSWSLRLRTAGAAPTETAETGASTAVVAIPESPAASTPGGEATSTIAIGGPGTSVQDVNLTTNIDHPAGSDLVIRLSAPDGTTTETISSRNGFDKNVFAGRVFDDDARPFGGNQTLPVTDNPFDLPFPPALVPEGAMGRFIGLDPRGTWTLRVTDNAPQDTGQINGWSLAIQTTAGVPPTTLVTPAAGAPTGPIPDAQPDAAPTPQPAPGGGAAPTPTTPAPTPTRPTTRPRAVVPRILAISAANTVRVRGKLRIVARFNRAPLGNRVVLQRKVGRRYLIVARGVVRNRRAILSYRAPARAGRQVLRIRFRVAAGLRFSRPIAVRVRAAR